MRTSLRMKGSNAEVPTLYNIYIYISMFIVAWCWQRPRTGRIGAGCTKEHFGGSRSKLEDLYTVR